MSSSVFKLNTPSVTKDKYNLNYSIKVCYVILTFQILYNNWLTNNWWIHHILPKYHSVSTNNQVACLKVWFRLSYCSMQWHHCNTTAYEISLKWSVCISNSREDNNSTGDQLASMIICVLLYLDCITWLWKIPQCTTPLVANKMKLNLCFVKWKLYSGAFFKTNTWTNIF